MSLNIEGYIGALKDPRWSVSSNWLLDKARNLDLEDQAHPSFELTDLSFSSLADLTFVADPFEKNLAQLFSRDLCYATRRLGFKPVIGQKSLHFVSWALALTADTPEKQYSIYRRLMPDIGYRGGLVAFNVERRRDNLYVGIREERRNPIPFSHIMGAYLIDYQRRQAIIPS